MDGPDPLMVGNQFAVAERLHPLQIGAHQHPAPDTGRVHRVVVGIQAHVVIAGQPQRGTPTGRRGHRRQRQHRGPVRADPIEGAQPSARRGRVLTIASQAASWALKSAGEANVRPGRNERSR